MFPVSNANVEWGFSAMRRIKSNWWSSLNEDTLDHLMRISIKGPPLEQFDLIPGVRKFFSTQRYSYMVPESVNTVTLISEHVVYTHHGWIVAN